MPATAADIIALYLVIHTCVSISSQLLHPSSCRRLEGRDTDSREANVERDRGQPEPGATARARYQHEIRDNERGAAKKGLVMLIDRSVDDAKHDSCVARYQVEPLVD